MSRQLFQQNERDTIQTKNHCLVQLLLKRFYIKVLPLLLLKLRDSF